MSNPSVIITNEELWASNTELKTQVEYLAKQIAQLTKFKMNMMNTPEESEEEQEEEAQSETLPRPTRRNNQEKSSTDFKVEIPTFMAKMTPMIS
ncbi:unnamed protein product [Cuscuta campestris]|uniref:Uncharacterized protein n=1 Tax=Cuscuta campestris TaxID=132261 RepID=A0A484N8W7_9ASTE|nr:unnamed protein product [Cuscuta campestris]